jgi:ANTAR domain
MMETGRDETSGSGTPRRPGRDSAGREDLAWSDGDHDGASLGHRGAGLLAAERGGQDGPDGYHGRHSQGRGPAQPGVSGGSRQARDPAQPGVPGGSRQAGASAQAGGTGPHGETPVARRTPTGWRVGDEEVSDLTSAMVLADLLAADLPPEGPPTPGSKAAADRARRAGRAGAGEQPDVRQLQETVAQLEHALTVRVRVEQAIGVLAERHRLRPRQAFELLRSAARARGRRVLDVAAEVVDSASNPLLRIPEELAKPPVARRRGRMSRRPLTDD